MVAKNIKTYIFPNEFSVKIILNHQSCSGKGGKISFAKAIKLASAQFVSYKTVHFIIVL